MALTPVFTRLKEEKETKKKEEEEDIWQQNPTMFQDLPVHGTMPSDQHKHWIPYYHSHFCTQPLSLKECMQIQKLQDSLIKRKYKIYEKRR